MSILEAIILGFIQGITEFLPISSSGHLVITNQLFGLTDPSSNLAFIVFLHLVSTLAIVIVFLQELLELATNRRLIGLIIIGIIPAALVGLLFENTITGLFSGVMCVGVALIANAFILILADSGLWLQLQGPTSRRQRVGIKNAILIGLAQALAIIPGISRSGATISCGLISGLDKKNAIKFSFFLAIPVILGAALVELKDFGKFTASFEPITILAGGITCFLASLIAIKLLIRVVQKSKLHYFSIYCLFLGLFIIVYEFISS